MPNAMLTKTLLLDAASAALFVLLCLGFTAEVSALLGLPEIVVVAAGWICVPSAALFLHQAFRPSRAPMGVVVMGNAGWVLASLAVWVAYFGQLTTLGHVVVLAQAAAVGMFALLERRGAAMLPGRAVTA